MNCIVSKKFNLKWIKKKLEERFFSEFRGDRSSKQDKMNKSGKKATSVSDKRIRAIRFSWYVFLRAGTACYPTP